MKNKGLLFLLVLLFIIALGGGGVGYYYNMQRTKEAPPEPVDPPQAKIVYLYYLEEAHVEEMPVNNTVTDEEGNETKDIKYKFSRFSCTNNLTGNFNEENWEFIPDEQKDSTCSLYFVNSKYDVTLTVINGEVEGENPVSVEREQNGKFKINPNAGYAFKEAQCSPNDKEATWDSSDNTLNITTITNDIMCKVSFDIKQLSAKITVVNGTGNTTETAKYGEAVSAIVTANDGYEKPTIECSNKQTATFENNKINIAKLTDDTECKVTFNAVPVQKYKLTFDLSEVSGMPISVQSGNVTQEIESGKDGTITLALGNSYSGYTPTLDCGGVTPSKVDRLTDTTIKYIFLSMSKDITCKVTGISQSSN